MDRRKQFWELGVEQIANIIHYWGLDVVGKTKEVHGISRLEKLGYWAKQHPNNSMSGSKAAVTMPDNEETLIYCKQMRMPGAGPCIRSAFALEPVNRQW